MKRIILALGIVAFIPACKADGNIFGALARKIRRDIQALTPESIETKEALSPAARAEVTAMKKAILTASQQAVKELIAENSYSEVEYRLFIRLAEAAKNRAEERQKKSFFNAGEFGGTGCILTAAVGKILHSAYKIMHDDTKKNEWKEKYSWGIGGYALGAVVGVAGLYLIATSMHALYSFYKEVHNLNEIIADLQAASLELETDFESPAQELSEKEQVKQNMDRVLLEMKTQFAKK